MTATATKKHNDNPHAVDYTTVELMDDRVIVRVETPFEGSTNLYIPDTVREKGAQTSVKGVVLAIGPGKKDDDGNLIPMRIQVGDRVLFNPYAGTHAELGREKVRIFHETEILAKLPPKV